MLKRLKYPGHPWFTLYNMIFFIFIFYLTLLFDRCIASKKVSGMLTGITNDDLFELDEFELIAKSALNKCLSSENEISPDASIFDIFLPTGTVVFDMPESHQYRSCIEAYSVT